MSSAQLSVSSWTTDGAVATRTRQTRVYCPSRVLLASLGESAQDLWMDLHSTLTTLGTRSVGPAAHARGVPDSTSRERLRTSTRRVAE
ncbi:hypothetical protein OH76DRAFT_152817 [Lentinus brumalis]|uniref:Uncharacterized protein n=1 Tax=Lentinus brumalis TaxID=2498619 RepID=A0A371CNT4_9APHY|nr:hypothetical protein OH76DRAFT_152817 [Polyporus brumalis]